MKNFPLSEVVKMYSLFSCIFSGLFPLSSTSLMTDSERSQFLPVVRTFTSILEKGNADPNETTAILQQVRQLNQLIPVNLRNSIEGLMGNFAQNPTKRQVSQSGTYHSIL